jgi:competence protein ComEC
MGGQGDRRTRRTGLFSRVATARANAWPLLASPAELFAQSHALLARQWAVEVEQRRLVLWVPACFGAGILLDLSADTEPSRWAPILALLACVAGALVRRARADAVFRLFVAASALFAGFAAAGWRTDRVQAPVLDRPRFAAVTAHVEAVDIRTSGGRLLLRPVTIEGMDAAAVPFRIRVTVPNRPAVQAGDFIAAQARLMPPPEPSRPGGYDFSREAYFAGLGAVGSMSGRIDLAPPTQPPGWGLAFAAAVDRARNGLTRRIVDAIGGPAGAVAASLVTGKRGLIPDATNEDLRAAGIYHVVSISGLHMVLAAGMIFWAVRALLALSPALALRWPLKKIAAVAAIAAAFAYNVFAGSEIATERSLVMTLGLLGAVLADRPVLSMRNLALAALVVLAMEPESLLGPSFQMSFAAVAALIAVFERPGQGDPQPEALGFVGLGARAPVPSPPAGPVLRHVLASWRHLRQALLTTLVAEAATAPFALYHFQRISPFGLAGNLLTLPLVSFVVMPAAVVGIVAMPFGWDDVVWRIMGHGVDAMLRISALVAQWPGAGGAMRGFGAPVLLVLSLAILWATLWRSALRWAAVPLVGLAILLAADERAPDVLVTADGQAVLARGGDGRLGVVGRRPSSFTLEQWLRADGDPRLGEDHSLFERARCDPDGCVASLPGGGAVAHVTRADAFEEDCRRAAVLVTPLRAPAYCRPPVLLDRDRLAGTGAVVLVPRGERLTSAAGESAAYDVVGQRRPTTDRPWIRKPARPDPKPRSDGDGRSEAGAARKQDARQPLATEPPRADAPSDESLLAEPWPSEPPWAEPLR